jgi:hypothetical protein
VVTIWLASSATCDALITAILVIALKTHKTGSKRSDLVIDRIIQCTYTLLCCILWHVPAGEMMAKVCLAWQ